MHQGCPGRDQLELLANLGGRSSPPRRPWDPAECAAWCWDRVSGDPRPRAGWPARQRARPARPGAAGSPACGHGSRRPPHSPGRSRWQNAARLRHPAKWPRPRSALRPRARSHSAPQHPRGRPAGHSCPSARCSGGAAMPRGRGRGWRSSLPGRTAPACCRPPAPAAPSASSPARGHRFPGCAAQRGSAHPEPVPQAQGFRFAQAQPAARRRAVRLASLPPLRGAGGALPGCFAAGLSLPSSRLVAASSRACGFGAFSDRRSASIRLMTLLSSGSSAG